MQKLCKAAIFHKQLISRYVFIQKYPQLAIPQTHQQIWMESKARALRERLAFQKAS